jgi:hypothetical protein
LTAKDSLRLLVVQTLEHLGWTPPDDETSVDSSQADNLRVDRPLGDIGRFGPSGDLAKGSVR